VARKLIPAQRDNEGNPSVDLASPANVFLILHFGVFSLTVTLGAGSFISGIILGLANSGTIAGGLIDLVTAVILTRVFGVPMGFYHAAVLTVGVWHVFQQTALDRRLLLVRRGREVARLSGVNVTRMRTGALIASSNVACFTPAWAAPPIPHRPSPSFCPPSPPPVWARPRSYRAASTRPAPSWRCSICRPASWGRTIPGSQA